MKKLIIFFFAIALSVGVKAQYYNGKIASDTLVNTDTLVVNKTVTGAKSNVTFVYTAKNVSGTTASVVSLYGSLDALNYVLLATDSVSATSNFSRVFNYNGYNIYKVQIVQSGTSATLYNVFSMYRN